MVLYIPPRKPDRIPVIDLSDSLGGDPRACQQTAAELRKAALDTGFFYVRFMNQSAFHNRQS